MTGFQPTKLKTLKDQSMLPYHSTLTTKSQYSLLPSSGVCRLHTMQEIEYCGGIRSGDDINVAACVEQGEATADHRHDYTYDREWQAK